MAIDTAAKRAAAAGFYGLPPTIFPDGTLDVGDRAAIVVSYNGHLIPTVLGMDEVQQQFDPGVLVELFDLDLNPIGQNLIVHFTPQLIGDPPVEIVWQTIVYNSVDLETEGWELAGRGVLPRPTLRVTNVGAVFQALTNQLADLVGAKITRTRTFSRFLDGQPAADSTVFFPKDEYVIARKVIQNKRMIEWELAAAIDQQGRRIPARQVLRDTCTHRYRVFNATLGIFQYENVTCPYVGIGNDPLTDGPFFESNGNSTADISKDLCGKRLSDCSKRFGNAPLPTRAFPGVALVR